MRIRYIAPAIPPLVILSIFGLYQLHELIFRRSIQGRGQRAGIAVAILSAVMFTFNGLYIVHQFRVVAPFDYLSGHVDRETYIAKYCAEYPIIQYANGQLGADVKILVLFMGNRRYYSERELTFDAGLFRAIVKNEDSASGILKNLHQKGFSHLLIRYDLFNKWTDKQFSDREKKMLRVFFDAGVKTLSSKNGYGLFELNFNYQG